MSDLISVARPYARAAFERAREAGDLDGWAEQLELLAAIAGDPQMQAVLANPRTPRAERAQLLLDVAADYVGPEPGPTMSVPSRATWCACWRRTGA